MTSIRAICIPDDEGPSWWETVSIWLSEYRPLYKFMSKHLTMPTTDDMRTDHNTIDALKWLDADIEWSKKHHVKYRLWRMYIVGTQPIQEIKDHTTRPLRRFWQRGRRGWCREDIWSVDGYLSRVIPEMLDELRKHNHGWPGDPMTFEEWNGDGGIIDKIAKAFSAHSSICNMDFIPDDEPREYAKYKPVEEQLQTQVDEGLQLFVRYFGDLWD